jgi:hypothetical protein
MVLSSVGVARDREPSRWFETIFGAVRVHFLALCAFIMCTGGFGFGWSITPEPAEVKLARIWAGVDLSIPIRTLPPNTKAVRCMLVWVGGPGGDPEMWCPAVPPLPEDDQAPPAISTS